MKDLLGKAILDFQTQNNPEPLFTETSISEKDEMDVSYMFRSYKEMPVLEQKALQMCQGKVLDVGCGAGSHTLYLQEKGIEVEAIDVSENAIQTCLLRGVRQAKCVNVLNVTHQKYDTILLLMNGTGIFGTMKNISTYLTHLSELLTPDGQILIDSSDLIYMFDEDDDGGKWIPMQESYYGELVFHVTYKGETDEPFPWLYLDYNTLQNACLAHHLSCELVMEGEHYDYLARIKKLQTL